ncbi:hypothetical protein H0H10_31875 [Streptomyces sp. TRM S81-3]|uniref:Uncharacterized protein n=1 Tax=Streptomyces griseicoloratus TaxID=2752516 RepID=A0A926L960_9ACTN|nr:hypothetical protein [Streptomyces griseicoloratus]MBD0423704.1 hypothetical protein [Streptomyces griseicoloratus]
MESHASILTIRGAVHPLFARTRVRRGGTWQGGPRPVFEHRVNYRSAMIFGTAAD